MPGSLTRTIGTAVPPGAGAGGVLPLAVDGGGAPVAVVLDGGAGGVADRARVAVRPGEDAGRVHHATVVREAIC